jgi:hypothetical protein
MTKTWQETDARTADDHGVIAGNIVSRSKVANDVLGPVVLANLMSSASVCSPSASSAQKSRSTQDASAAQDASAESIAKLRETTVDDLLADPMMSALWQAYAITEADVRRLVTDIADRLKSHGELHRRAEALVARCA